MSIAKFKHLAICLSLLLAVLFPCSSSAQGTVKIKLEGAKSMKNLKVDGENIVRHIGNVRFSYSDTRITCDSSYMNSTRNFFDAYGSVVITQGKTKIYGDKLHFDGNSSWATVWGKEVLMVDGDTRLKTDQLKYNTKQKYAYYYTSGEVISDDLVLTSRNGYLYSDNNQVYFSGNVVLHSSDGDAFTDSLNYSTKIKVANFFGPSYLFYNDDFIYCERGSYNANFKQATASKRAYLLSKENKIFGDNIFFDDSLGYAYVNGNAVIIDTINQTYIYGQQAQYWEEGGRAKVNGKPHVAMVDSKDTLYLKADTLLVNEFKTPALPDSSYTLLRGLGSVMFFRNDVQGLCDSIRYNTFDSIMLMYGNPVLWENNNQMTADIIEGFTKNSTIERMKFKGSAFVAMEEAPDIYNQMRGKDIVARFVGGNLTWVDVIGNAQAVYYMRDGDDFSIVNRAESSNITINIKNNKIARIRFSQQPKSNLYPVDKVDREEITLNGFKWLGEKRPKDKTSIVPKKFVLVPTETGAARRKKLKATLSRVESGRQGDNGKITQPKSDIQKTENSAGNLKKKQRKGLFDRNKE